MVCRPSAGGGRFSMFIPEAEPVHHRLDPRSARFPADNDAFVGNVLSIDRITRDMLLAVIRDEIAVAVWPGLVPAAAAAELAEIIVSTDRRQQYAAEPEIAYVADAYFDSVGHPAARRAYFANAHENTNLLRGLNGAPTHLDLARLLIEEAWPLGARVQHIGGQQLSVGIARVFAAPSKAGPHQDMLSWDAEIGRA